VLEWPATQPLLAFLKHRLSRGLFSVPPSAKLILRGN
jgi:hypothetical protein